MGCFFTVSHLLPGKIQISGLRKHDISPAFSEIHKDQLRKPYVSAEAAVTDSYCQRRLWHSLRNIGTSDVINYC